MRAMMERIHARKPERYLIAGVMALAAIPICTPTIGFAAAPVTSSARGRAYKPSQSMFDPRGLETFDGTSWSGLTLGQTTENNVKDKLRTKKNSAFPDALALEQPDESDVQIDLLFGPGGGDSRLQAISIRCLGDGFSLASVERAMRISGQAHYEKERPEDRRFVLYRNRGVLLLVVDEQVRQILLAPADKLAHWADSATSESETLIQSPYPTGTHTPLLVEFGQIKYDYNLDDRVSLDRSAVEKELNEQIQGLSGGGLLRYREGAPGKLVMHLTVQNGTTSPGGKGGKRSNDVPATAKAICEIRGAGPYGPVDVSFQQENALKSGGSGMKMLLKMLSSSVPTGDAGGKGSDAQIATISAAQTALKEADSKFAEFVEADAPENRRDLAWANLIRQFRAQAN